MSRHAATQFIAVAAGVLLLVAVPPAAQASPEPGTILRNDFGPKVGNRANQCRGACGAGCPDTCSKSVYYECVSDSSLRRVVTYDCGTHQACRVHDDCLDTCLSSDVPGGECQRQCDADVIQRYGLDAGSWLLGKGPYDGRITYEYSRDDVDAQEPAYRCPDGASRQCSGRVGCLAANGHPVDPAFDSYAGVRPGTMRVTAFRAGPECNGKVCEHSEEIRVSGSDACPAGPCTRFGMEFDYRDADPTKPLECSVSTSGGDGDFIGDLLKLGAEASVTRNADAPPPDAEDGMGQLLGLFQKVLTSADSPEDVQISMAPLDEHGNPIESQRVGSDANVRVPPIPRSIPLPAASGHLFVPMYQLADGSVSGAGKERRLRCTHDGVPVLETTFRLVAD